MPTFPAIHHLALSVTDLTVSEPWYVKLVGAEPAMTLSDGPFQRRVFALPSGQLMGLTQHDGVEKSAKFVPSAPGMDHVGFGVSGREEIEQWRDHLDSVGIEHSGVVEADYGLALSFKDPDGNALEFFHLAG
ncbi:MAG: VOC family protein [Pseudonocardia sediminis]